MKAKEYNERSSGIKHKRVLITGIDGFIGSHLSQALKKQGAFVFGFSKKPYTKEIDHIDILNKKDVSNFIREKNTEICFHLAGLTLVESGQTDPYETFRVNIQGTLNILESCRSSNIQKVIIASTVHVYGNNKLPYYEEYTPRPTRPYETSKACADLIAQSYEMSFNLPVLIPRFVNIYGPGDMNFTRLIPKTIQSILTQEKVTIWGGNAIRDYLYIDDVVDAYIKLATADLKKIGDNRIFNFGSGNRISALKLVEKILAFSKKDIDIIKIRQERIEEIEKQYVSFKKSNKLLHWTPSTSLDQGLQKTFRWYKTYFRDK